MDLRERFAHPLPMRIVCELFGVPGTLREDTVRLVSAIMDTSDPTPEHAASVQRQIGTVLPALIGHKTAHPGDDMTTELIRVRDEDGDRLSEEELLHTLLLVIGAGFETTVNLIGNAVVALLRRPEQLAAVRAGRIGWDAVVDETLRAHPSIASLPLRFAVGDLTVGDVRIPAGDAIITTYAAAGLAGALRSGCGRCRRSSPSAGRRSRSGSAAEAAGRTGGARERDRSPVPVGPPRCLEPTSRSEAV